MRVARLLHRSLLRAAGDHRGERSNQHLFVDRPAARRHQPPDQGRRCHSPGSSSTSTSLRAAPTAARRRLPAVARGVTLRLRGLRGRGRHHAHLRPSGRHARPRRDHRRAGVRRPHPHLLRRRRRRDAHRRDRRPACAPSVRRPMPSAPGRGGAIRRAGAAVGPSGGSRRSIPGTDPPPTRTRRRPTRTRRRPTRTRRQSWRRRPPSPPPPSPSLPTPPACIQLGDRLVDRAKDKFYDIYSRLQLQDLGYFETFSAEEEATMTMTVESTWSSSPWGR